MHLVETLSVQMDYVSNSGLHVSKVVRRLGKIHMTLCIWHSEPYCDRCGQNKA
jgi:hypothetical protein